MQVKDEDIASYYEQNKSRFGQPERRRVSHIMISIP
ncbi:PPIC-type PPIASE domain protein, partial [Bordetella bronchiseptica E010]